MKSQVFWFLLANIQNMYQRNLSTIAHYSKIIQWKKNNITDKMKKKLIVCVNSSTF